MSRKPPHENIDNTEGQAVADLGTDEMSPMDRFLKFARALTKVSKEEMDEKEEADRKDRDS